MKNLDVVLSEKTNGSDRLQFEEEKNQEAKSKAEEISYGLNLRVKEADSGIAQVVASETSESVGLLKDVKVDINSLPDDEGFNEFDEMPVEEFGAALLSGLGWYKSRGIGRNPKGDVEIKQVEKKSFVSDDVVIASKERELDGFSVEKTMKVNSTSNGKSNGKSKYEDGNSGNRKSKREDRFLDDNGRGRDSERREKRERREEERVRWLRSFIRVRVISKELNRGRFYLKKGKVVDVVGPNTCDLTMDEGGELVQGVDQDFLETALPKSGGPVLVLFGKHKGVYGNLVKKDLDRETGVVRNADNHELLNVKLEQIAEYVGDPSYIGY